MNILMNGAYRGQRVTGQQRYATELGERLLRRADVRLAEPDGRWSRSAAMAWAWCQGPALRPPRGAVTVSLTSRAAVLNGRQVVAVHDLFVLTNPEWYSRKYVVTHAAALRLQLATARGVVCVSPQTMQAVEGIAPDVPKRLVSNGVALPTPLSTDEVRGHSSDKSYLLCVSSVDPRKNVSALVAAYRQLPPAVRQDVDLVLVGGHNKAVFGGVKISSTVGVRLAGYVTDRELDVLYRRARALVMPSLAEGFGLPLIEAAARGVPVVCSDIPVFRWICRDAAIYVDPKDVESIAHGMMRALSSEPSNAELRSFSDEVLGRFSWDRGAVALYDFAREVQ